MPSHGYGQMDRLVGRVDLADAKTTTSATALSQQPCLMFALTAAAFLPPDRLVEGHDQIRDTSPPASDGASIHLLMALRLPNERPNG
jgi:hypothetical protein